ncbi:MAG: peptidase [Lachnospiraceae bacterium]|nr:peptidase [Lachnospiraceae bacterium]MCI9357286.1 peptidase [Lachnospiraceae bacterium]
MDINIFLYDDFDTIDLACPVWVFGSFPKEFHLNYLSAAGDVVNSAQGMKVWTEPLAADGIDGIFVIPGGRGARRMIRHDEKYIRMVKECIASSSACLMVGNAAGIVAQTGLLYNRNAADYEGAENWKKMFTAAVRWIPDAQWVADGKFYSCRNSLSALDMSLGAVADLADMSVAEKIAETIHYKWELDETGYY